jgi:recombination protein RecA
MSALQAIDLRGLRTHLDWAAATPRTKTPLWSREQLAGRLCELSSISGAALLTAAFRLVLDAQLEGEPAAWVAAGPDTFFAPDAAENGVDLDALVVIRVPDAQAAGRAADRLLRSGAFGLIVMDLNFNPTISVPLQARLVQQARTHDAALLCLTSKARRAPSLGSMVSLRGQTSCRRLEVDRFQYQIEILKDKRHGPGWSHTEVCRGPDGLH